MSRAFVPEPSLSGAPNTAIPDSPPPQSAEAVEFEFVLGKRQVASVSLVVLTALAAFTAGAYMVGKGSAKTVEVRVTEPQQPVLPAPAAPSAPVTSTKPAEAPLFGSPEKDRLYIQLGSVERGFAVMMVHGARKLGYSAFASNGTNNNVYRVLVGPFSNQDEYKIAKTTFESMGLDTFTRKYDPPATTPSEPVEP